MNFSLGECQSFSERNFFVDAFAKKGDSIIIEVQLPQEAFLSVLKMD